MKKFLTSISKFLVLTIVFYFILLFIWGQFAPRGFKPNLNYRMGSYGHMNSRIKEVKNTKDVDLLFLGSSHAYRGFDTRIFDQYGYKSFNLGSSAQTPIQTKILLERYLDQLNPKMIVYEVYPVTFSIDGVESALDLIANDHIEKSAIKMVFQLNNLKAYNTLFYGLMCQGLHLNDDFKEPVVKGNDTYISGGFVSKKMAYFRHEKFPDKHWEFNQDQFRAFEEILEMIQRRKIKFLLVNSPIAPNLYASYDNNNVFDSLMNTYGAYYNFNNILSLDDSLHFFDSNHLNAEGVKVFDHKLIEEIIMKR